MILSSFNPANGTLLRSYDALSAEAMTAKIANAHQGFLQYRETPLEDRVMWMKKLAGILEQEMEELATLLTMETGKTISASRNEILNCAACCRFYAEHAGVLLAEEKVELDANRCVTTWRPMGALLAVMPGSSAFWQAFQFAVPALLGGNTVVLKHSSCLPQCAVEMELLVRRAGFGRGVFQTLLLGSAAVETVLNDERVAGVAIAGTKKTTRELAARTALMGKKAVVQRGGSNAMIVLPSANLFAAIQAGVAARCVDNGQSSASTAKFIVHTDVYDDFAMLFAAAMEDVKIGNPLKDETELGPLATERSVIRLTAQVAEAIAAGARVLTGGEAMLGDGTYFEPTVMVDVPLNSEVCRESIEGPVALLFRVESLEDAVAVANKTDAASVSVWTQDVEEQQLSRRLTAGGVFMNAPVAMDARMGSGCGLTMAAAALHEFMTTTLVVRAETIPGEDFNFELALDGFDEEDSTAEAVQPENADAVDSLYEAFGREDELSLEEDIFVGSHDAKSSDRDAAVGVMDVAAVQASVAVMQAPEMAVARVPMVSAATSPVVERVEEAEAEVVPAALSFQEMFERALQVRA